MIRFLSMLVVGYWVWTRHGILSRSHCEHYYIRDNDGVVQRIHVDKSTELDKVITGRLVKVYVTDQAGASQSWSSGAFFGRWSRNWGDANRPRGRQI